ncbi:MAG: ATP-binding cassette domain-containing protein [Pseudomonadota bacterium]
MRLSIVDLVVQSADGRMLVHVPSLTVRPGEAIGLQGPSGAGKSTLLFALAGLAERVSGKVMWCDRDIVRMAADARAAFRRENVGLVFQDFLLFEELGALDNAALSAAFAPRSVRARVKRHALRKLSEFGVPIERARRVASLSGGERQRVAMARAFANDPPILLMDEPTASLDRKTADPLIADLVKAARHDRKILIAASHDPALLTQMDRIIELRDGRIVDA